MSKSKDVDAFVPTAPAMYPAQLQDFYKSNGGNHSIVFSEPSLTRQEFADECDINQLMKRYETFGGTINGLPNNSVEPMYIDFAEMPDTLMGYMAFMDEAQNAFMTLPASIRKEFDNNAHAFVDYAANPLNVEQMRIWGLAKPAEKPAEAPVSSPSGVSPGEPPKPS